ncbi:hypothetical protein ALC57_09000 [Trachymyrmex cornetzi]|uniref:SAP domain-containing protein n=1 Tax=Trachymyrmex cornetzi TaxID=471704 RepID=A0A151J6B5_9HYME|nr:hypothetical protein ALC57_09000 [Trachymyrmex cornetzi]
MEMKREKESERNKGRNRFEMRELSDYTASELKLKLKFKKLPTTGLKEDLVKRLQAHQQYPSQTIKKSNAILSEKERKQTDVTAAIRCSTNISIARKKIEMYRREIKLLRKEKELLERELAFMKKEHEKIQRVQVNTDAHTHEKCCCFHKPLKDRHIGDDFPNEKWNQPTSILKRW